MPGWSAERTAVFVFSRSLATLCSPKGPAERARHVATLAGLETHTEDRFHTPSEVGNRF
jgi:hypothetical protein